MIVGPEGPAEDALAAANDVPLRAVRGERRYGRVLFGKLIKSLRRLGAGLGIHAGRAVVRQGAICPSQ